jgi:hypothetical protein
MAVLLKHADELPLPPRKAARHVRISDELEAAILRALEKEPGKRWPSAEAFAAALEATPEGGESKIPLVDITMHEIGDSKTVLGRRRAADAASPSRVLPMRWIARLAVVAIVGVGLTMLWSKFSRRERQNVVQKVDQAVGSAKDILHSLTAPTPTPPTPATRPELDDSIQTLFQLRRQNPRNADVALRLGHAYFRKQRRADGLREYGEALKLRPALRNDRQLQRNAIVALDDPTFKPASAFIRARLGSAAIGELRRAGRQAKSPKVQTRAARLAVELAKASRSSARR